MSLALGLRPYFILKIYFERIYRVDHPTGRNDRGLQSTTIEKEKVMIASEAGCEKSTLHDRGTTEALGANPYRLGLV